VIQTKRISHWL